MRIIPVLHEVALVLADVEQRLEALLVGFGLEIVLVVVEGGGELVVGDDAFNLAIFDEFEVGVLFDQLLQFGLLGSGGLSHQLFLLRCLHSC